MNENGQEDPNSEETPIKRPSSILISSGLAGIEVLGILAIVFWYIQHTLAGEFFDLASTLFQILLALLAVVWVAGGTIGVWLGKNIAKALLVVFQIIMIAIGVSLIQSGSEGMLTGVASLLIILGGAVIALLFTKPSTAWLADGR